VKVDLTSFTDVANHALYDPSVVTSHAEDPEKTLALVPDGRLFVVDTAADGEIHWRLYVDEPMPAELQPRIERATRDILLRVPTGRLCASGLEYVGQSDDTATSSVGVPAGNYLVDVFELDFDWDRDIAPVLEREIGAGYKRELRVGPLGGLAIFVGLVVAVIGALTWHVSLLGAGLGVLLLGVVVLAVGLPKGDYEAKKRAIAMRFPSLVLVLRPLADDADVTGHEGAVLRCAE
jgi:hypothetical protein